MRRRVLSLLATLLLALALVAGPALAADEPAPDLASTSVLLAAGEVTGPEPAPRDAEDNPARELGGFNDKEIQFTWAAAWLLTAAFVFALLAGVLFFEFRVRRPSQEAAGRR